MGNKINIELIETYIKENSLSKTRFCQKCKIDLRTYEKIMNNDLKIDLKVLFKVAKVMNIKVYEMFK